jgi:hypothetical protein
MLLPTLANAKCIYNDFGFRKKCVVIIAPLLENV